MNRHTGEQIDTMQHIRQSVTDILTTPIGSRVMRREYGSLLPSLIDAPANDAERLRAVAAAVIAIMRWEPRIRMHQARFTSIEQTGQAELDIDAEIIHNNQGIDLSIPLRMGASA